jgi:hypothetical protein
MAKNCRNVQKVETNRSEERTNMETSGSQEPLEMIGGSKG